MIQSGGRGGFLGGPPAGSGGGGSATTDAGDLTSGTLDPARLPPGVSPITLGTSTVNFGAFPGTTDVTLAVTGQASIGAGSTVWCWLQPTATADHSADEHWVDGPEVMVGNVVAGTGFTLYSRIKPQAQIIPPNTTEIRRNGVAASTGLGVNLGRSLNTPRIYGTWTVAWAWQ